MKSKHLQIRIKQCLLLASASNCPRAVDTQTKRDAETADLARDVVYRYEIIAFTCKGVVCD